jgi:hypothetical protein
MSIGLELLEARIKLPCKRASLTNALFISEIGHPENHSVVYIHDSRATTRYAAITKSRNPEIHVGGKVKNPSTTASMPSKATVTSKTW